MIIYARDNNGDNDSWDDLYDKDVEWFAEELSHLWDQVEVYEEGEIVPRIMWINGERVG